MNHDIRDGELALINRYTRHPLAEKEVYAFSVVLCDNEIDRDFERFSDEALDTLATLFEGVTGISDHEPKSANQTARIFSCKTESLPDRLTFDGRPYKRLTARAYLPVSDASQDMILALESGMKKEVSVGCAVKKRICSVCGKDIALCPHTKGRTYDNQLCFVTLDEPVDAYEWSFVAVPAQRSAGVTKHFLPKGVPSMNLEQKLFSGEEQAFSAEEVRQLAEQFRSLRQKAADGDYYRCSLLKELDMLAAVALPELPDSTLQKMTDSLSVSQLDELVKVFRAKAADVLPPVPQLCREDKKSVSANSLYQNI